jgi:N-acetylglucosamine-6-phosphate deacetylase
MEIRGLHYRTGFPLTVTLEQGRISRLEVTSGPRSPELPWLAPGLFDLQVNGAQGCWFSSEQLTVEEVLQVLRTFQRHGVARLFPTLITNSREALEHGFHVLERTRREVPWADRMMAGYHLEGPWISPEDGPRGAHPLAHVRPCDPQELGALQRSAGGRIRLLTLAPEVPGALDLIRQAIASGVVCAIGHTAATAAEIAAAVAAGASLSTHFGNGSHGVLPRHPNYLWDQLAEPRLAASVIPDGQHVPAAVLRAVLLAKGAERVIVTSDASGLAGSPPGIYPAAGAHCEVLEDGRIVVAGQRQYLAGSGAFTEECVAGMMRLTGVDLPTAWHMAQRNPGALCRVAVPQLSIGTLAELVSFRVSAAGEIQVEQTIGFGHD